jgi:hypothetical protein
MEQILPTLVAVAQVEILNLDGLDLILEILE